VFVHANIWAVLLFVAVAIAALTFTACAFLAWMRRQEEEELSPLHDIQENLARMMQEADTTPNRAA
jgi:HAMP domain-containing protein